MSRLFAADDRNGSALQISSADRYFKMFEKVIARLPHSTIEQAAAELLIAYEENRTIFLFGNGGSAALASHFACDLGKGTIGKATRTGERQKRFRVLALTDNLPLVTAWANDSCYEDVFAEQLRNFVQPGDVVFAISGSGNSANVLRALEVAHEAGALNIGLTGFAGGKMKDLCTPCIVIPSENMQIIEDLHLSVTHAIFSVVRHRLNQCNNPSEFAVGASSAD
jgi:D-sedoheptulose 7-phosphate isomerase